MLNVSRREQAKRFLKRIDHPEKNWKFSPSDVRERRYWDEYRRAFDIMLSQTSTKWAPWYVVPADHKWFSRLATAAVLVRALHAIDPKYPAADPAAREQMMWRGPRSWRNWVSSRPALSRPAKRRRTDVRQ